MPYTGFNVHLVSNVSVETFPNNNPSKFSTILADDITLPGDGWEVAVKSIMYPSHVASGSDEDTLDVFNYKDNYRKLLPVPARGEHEHSRNHVPLEFKLPTIPTMRNSGKASLSSTIADYINAVAATKRLNDVFGMSVRESNNSSKFILDILYQDIVIMMHPALRKYLGFKHDKPFMKGTIWAWSPFNPAAKPPASEEQVMIVTDLKTQMSEKYEFTSSYEVVTKPQKKAKQGSDDGDQVVEQQIFFETQILLRFKDDKDDDLLWEPKTTFIMNPLKGEIKLIKPKRIPPEIAKFERKITFFRFPKNIQETFGLDPLYFYRQLAKSSYIIHIPKVTAKKIKAVPSFSVEVFFEGVRELDYTMADTPIQTIKVAERKDLDKPSDFLVSLNKAATLRDFKFHYDEERKRFSLQTGKETFLRFSRTLASILGFTSLPPERIVSPSSTVWADECPVIDRAITTLYIYSNIVNSVYIGDVKAPLLLTCPFRKDPHANVIQLEFLNPTFTSLNRSTIRQIDISIYDEAGSLVPFLYGKTVLTLHFRKT